MTEASYSTPLHDTHDPTRRRKLVRDRYGNILDLGPNDIVPDGGSVTVPLFLRDAEPDPLKADLSRQMHDIAEVDLMARAGHAGELARLGRAEGLIGAHSDAVVLQQAVQSMEAVARTASSPALAREASEIAERGREKLAASTGRPVERASPSGEVSEADVREAHEAMRERNRNAWRQPRPAPLASTSTARPQPQPEPQDDGTAEGAHAAMRARNRNAWREGLT
jgi:hypothetical protein